MKISLKVTHNGVVNEVIAGPPVLVAFEREHHCSTKTLAEDQRLEHLWWIAWYACRRSQRTTLDFDTWVEGLEEVEVAEEAAVPPLPETASHG